MKTLAQTNLTVFPLCLGTHAFGSSAGERESVDVLNAYESAGGNFIDTAEIYSAGESEAIVGKWLAMRGNRHRMVLATKLGWATGLSARNIYQRVDESLKRLQTEYIDLYFAHRDDESVPLEETLEAFDHVIKSGKVRYIAASNYSAPRLRAALATSERHGLASYVALQPHYNLMERAQYEGDLKEVCEAAGIACIPYRGLAQGFLTGQHRSNGRPVDSPMAEAARGYLNDRGQRVLGVLDEISAERATTIAAIALAWLASQPTVATPIAGARSKEQLKDLLPMSTLQLSREEIGRLDLASS